MFNSKNFQNILSRSGLGIGQRYNCFKYHVYINYFQCIFLLRQLVQNAL